MKLFFSICFSFFIVSALAQENNGGKKLYSKSFLNKKVPELIVQEWLTKKPDTRGKFVLIDFSATWCHACRKSMPELNYFQKKFADKLAVIFITKETPEKVRAAKNFLVEVASAVDTVGATSKVLEIKGIPHIVLVDPKGFVRWEGFPSSKDFEISEDVLISIFEKYGHNSGTAMKKEAVKKVLAESGISGSVKTVSEFDYTGVSKNDAAIKGKLINKKVSAYDEKGNLVDQRLYKSGDTLLSSAAFKYDSNGNLTERSGHDADGSLFSKTVFINDAKGNPKEEIIYLQDGSWDSKTSYKLDARGKLIEEKLQGKNGDIIYRSVFTYAPSGKILDKTIYNGSGGISSKYSAKYDQKGNRLEEKITGSDGALMHRYTFEYDAKGNKISDKVYNEDNMLTSVYTYTYSWKNKLQEERVNYPDGALVLKYVYNHDENGNLIATYRYDPGGDLYLQSFSNPSSDNNQIIWDYYNQGKLSTKFINSYENMDKAGNWQKRTRMANKNIAGITEREIRYHDSYIIKGTSYIKEGKMGFYPFNDSIAISNGKFEYRGTTEKAVLSILSLSPSDRGRVILEPGVITVTHTKEKGFTISGTPNNERLQKMAEEIKPYNDKVATLWRNYNRASGEERDRLFKETELARVEQSNKQRELIFADSNFSGLVELLPYYRNEKSADALRRYLAHFQHFSNDDNYKRFVTYSRGALNAAIGETSPDWTRPDENGNMITLSSLKGKYVLVDFWFADCHWCRKMTPGLINIYKDFKDKGKNFEIISLSVDTKEKEADWRKAMEEDGAPWPQAWDYEKKLPAEYGVTGYPTMFLLNTEGKILEKIIGFKEEKYFRELLAKYIK